MKDEPLTLQLLVQLALRKRDASARGLATLAQKNGFRVVGTTLSAIAAGTYKSRPSDETIRAIAWLADVREPVGFAAAGRSVPGPPFAQELPPDVDYLTPRKRRVVIDLLRVMVEEDRRAALNGPREEQQPHAQDQQEPRPPTRPPPPGSAG